MSELGIAAGGAVESLIADGNVLYDIEQQIKIITGATNSLASTIRWLERAVERLEKQQQIKEDRARETRVEKDRAIAAYLLANVRDGVESYKHALLAQLDATADEQISDDARQMVIIVRDIVRDL